MTPLDVTGFAGFRLIGGKMASCLKNAVAWRQTMFVTNPSFQFDAPPALALPGGRYYRAVELTGRMPWFLLTLHVNHDELPFLHTVACHWENDLAEFLRNLPAGNLASLQYVEPDPEKFEDWRLRSIKRVWETEDPKTGVTALVFEGADAELFMGPFGNPSVTPATRCRVLAQVHPLKDGAWSGSRPA